MKKIFTYLVFIPLLTAFSTTAQVSVPNGDMEDWNTILFYKEPVGWATPNPLTSLIGIFEVEQSTDVTSGSFAAKLSAHYISGFGVVVPGAMGTGKLDAITQTFTGGFPFSGQPEAVIGYYKYLPNNNDSCLIFTVLTKWDALAGSRDTIAISAMISGAVPSYTQFAAPFFYLVPGTAPDSALVIVSTASNPLTAQDSSVLYVDDIDFTNSVGMGSVSVHPVQFYPNPASETILISVPEVAGHADLIVSGLAGNEVLRLKYQTGGSRINISDLAPGVYSTRLKNQHGEVVAAGMFTVIPH